MAYARFFSSSGLLYPVGAKKVHLYDFDGNATNVPGNMLVFTKFFQKLHLDMETHAFDYDMDDCTKSGYCYKSDFKDYKKLAAYIQANRAMLEEMLENNKKGDRPQPILLSDVFISAEVLEHLKELLTEENTVLCFITKNQVNYVKAMLFLAGISEEDIEKRIQIYSQGDKKRCVGNLLGMYGEQDEEFLPDVPAIQGCIRKIVAVDDVHAELLSMEEAALQYKQKKNQDCVVIAILAPARASTKLVSDPELEDSYTLEKSKLSTSAIA